VPWKRDRAFLRQISLVMGQLNQLVWDIPALDSFELNRAIYRIPQVDYRRMLAELSDLLELGALIRKLVRYLSLGERMICEITAGLLHRPQVVFLDEHTIGLDVTMQRRIRAFIAEYNRSFGATVLLTSHYMADVEALCRRVIVIQRGHLLFDGDLSRLVQKFTAHRGSDRAGFYPGGRVKGLVELYAQQFKTTFAAMLQYRASLLIWMISQVLEPVVYLVVWSTVSNSRGGSVGDYDARSFAAYFILMMLVNQVSYTWILYEYEYRVRQGTLDFTLAKPEDAQLLVSVQRVEIWKLIDLGLGFAVLATAMLRLGDKIVVWQAAAFTGRLVAGAVILYSFWLILATLSFWFVRVENILEIFQSMYQAGRWPVSLYPGWLRFALTFIVPVAFATTVPAEALTGRLTLQSLLGACGLAPPCGSWRAPSGASACSSIPALRPDCREGIIPEIWSPPDQQTERRAHPL
jgi:ABC-type uncharacterized transport system permease subunit/ABC-type Na+ transport system ATPase subunit NatA